MNNTQTTKLTVRTLARRRSGPLATAIAFTAAAVIALFTGPASFAAMYYWTGTAGNGNMSGTPANWGGTVPTSTDTAAWNAATYTTAPTANANMTIGELWFGGSNGAVTFGVGANTLTLNGVLGVGIQMDSGSGAVNTGSAKFAIGADQSWINNSANTFTVGATITNSSATVPRTLTIDGSGNTTLNGILSNNTVNGPLSLTKTGTGTLTLIAANTFTGGLNIYAGMVRNTNNADRFGLGTISLGDPTPGNNNSATIDTIAPAKSASAQPIVVNAGSSGTLAIISTYSGGGGGFDFTFSGNVTLNHDLTLAMTGQTGGGIWDRMVFSGVISGGSNLNIGDATYTNKANIKLSNANTFTGTTTVKSGYLWLANSGALGSSTLDATNCITGAAGAGLRTDQTSLTIGSLSGSKNLLALFGTTAFNSVNNGGYAGVNALTLNPGTGVSSTYSGVIANGASGMTLTKSGLGTQTLSGANIYSGATTVSAGTLTLNRQTGSLAITTPLTMGGGTFNMDNVGASGALSQTLGALTFSAGDNTVQITRTANQNQALTFASLAARTAGATGNFVNSGGTNSATNGVILTGAAAGFINQGTFFGGSNYAWMDGTGTFVRGINYTSPDTDAESITASTTAFTAGKLYEQVTGSGAITGQTAQTITTLNIANASNFVLAASQTLTVNGILKSGNAAGGTLSGGTGIQAASNAELVIRTDGASDTMAISSPIIANGTNALTKSGAGLLTLSGANSYTGQTYVNGGTLSIGANANLGAQGTGATVNLNNGILQATGTFGLYNVTAGTNNRAVVLTNAAGIEVTGANTLTVAGVISGAGALNKSGTGILVISGANTFSGGLVIKAGTVSLGATATSAGSRSITIGDGSATAATLNLGGLNMTFANAVILNGSTEIITATSTGTGLTGGVSGTGDLIIQNTRVSGGNGTVTFSGGSLNNTGTITNSNTGVSSNSVTISSVIGSNVTGLTQGTGNTLILTSANTSFIGDTTLTAGTLNLRNTNALQKSVLTMNGGTVTFGTNATTGLASVTLGGLAGSSNISLNDTLTIPGAVALTIGNSNSSNGSGTNPNTLNPTYSGILSNGTSASAASLTKVGSNTQTLSGANTYSGATTIQAGTLVAGAAAPASANGVFGNASSALVLGNGSTGAGDAPALLINGAYTVARNITVGSVANSAAYNAILGGSNTSGTSVYTGGITLDTTAANYAVTLEAATGGTVDFQGVWTTNNKPISIGAVGKTGTVQISSAINTSGGIFVNYGTLAFSGSGTLGGGTVTVSGGTLDLNNLAVATNIVLSGGSLANASAYTGTLTASSGTALSGNVGGIVTLGTGGSLTADGSGVTFNELRGSGTISGGTVTATTLSPGNSPGLIAVTTYKLLDGQTYKWQLLDATGVAGTGYDSVSATMLDLTGLTNVNGYTIDVQTLSGITPGDVAGEAINFNKLANYSWTLFAGTNDLSSAFNAARIKLDLVDFANSYTGNFAVALSADKKNIMLNYAAAAIPEPGTLGLLAFGALALLGRRKKR